MDDWVTVDAGAAPAAAPVPGAPADGEATASGQGGDAHEALSLGGRQ